MMRVENERETEKGFGIEEDCGSLGRARVKEKGASRNKSGKKRLPGLR